MTIRKVAQLMEECAEKLRAASMAREEALTILRECVEMDSREDAYLRAVHVLLALVADDEIERLYDRIYNRVGEAAATEGTTA